ncbi:MAG TPA: DUF664 domain-containing protein [Acidimicrobiales bacterium]|nr:DUF664 domain-containing protein [Acidimicrobiales bacterium]
MTSTAPCPIPTWWRRRGTRGAPRWPSPLGWWTSPQPRCHRGHPRNEHGSGGRAMSLREVLIGMIEEYARHLGHVDLLRERIDGRVGQ